MKRVLLAMCFCACSGGGGDHDGGDGRPSVGDGPAGDGDETAGFRVVLDGFDDAILSIAGTAADDLFAVGGALRQGLADDEEIVLWHDGATWWRFDLPDVGTLWWVHYFAHDDVWAAGERGTIVRFDGSDWTVVEGGGYAYTLWGIWGASPDEMWAVGGSATGATPAIVRRYSDGVWTDEDVGLDLTKELFFKVWGCAADDMWVVGESGLALHRDGGGWEVAPTGFAERLVTVWGRACDDVWAVGGLSQGGVLRWDGKVWDSVGPDLINGLMGVWTCAGEDVFVSGMRGGMASGGADAWRSIYGVTNFDLHGVWGDCDGNVLMGGGELFTTKPPPAGVIVGRGEFAPGPPRAWEE